MNNAMNKAAALLHSKTLLWSSFGQGEDAYQTAQVNAFARVTRWTEGKRTCYSVEWTSPALAGSVGGFKSLWMAVVRADQARLDIMAAVEAKLAA